jgi:hypothetical protein
MSTYRCRQAFPRLLEPLSFAGGHVSGKLVEGSDRISIHALRFGRIRTAPTVVQNMTPDANRSDPSMTSSPGEYPAT